MMEMTIVLDHDRGDPLYLQLYQSIKKEIHVGKIEPGVKLPSKRKLALHLEISQTTVETAYEQLLAEGYVESIPRKGIYVREINNDLFTNVKEVFNDERMVVSKPSDSFHIDFSHGKIDLDAFPISIWRKLSVQSLYHEESALFLNGDRQGEGSLREELADYLYQSRGVRCSPEQIIVGAGTQYLICLLTLIIGRELVFSMEEPGFHRTREAFKDQGVMLKQIPLDQNGINIKLLYESEAEVTYVTPSHQFPMGMVMPINRRMELLQWAKEREGYIIEDDYDGEFRYKGKPIPSLQGLDTNGRVVYFGTFSKSLIPSIRISFMVLPMPLLEKYNQHFSIYKQTISRLHQHTLEQFMKNGHWERHLNKMRTVYRKKQQVLIHSIKKYLGDHVEVVGDDSGLHILLKVKNTSSETELIEQAAKFGVKVYPTSVYYENGDSSLNQMILLGFGGVSEAEIEKGIQLLGDAWFGAL
ncbi:PLP-dependent aminotransferase family protein [Mesobacillus maritimus]|uniref:MocR-like pyridoxine biosynthesis transcription factor PdxR n=1 Tax=Mesobacillus maritimus TaxID=1643336 RepID=UPI00384D37FC